MVHKELAVEESYLGLFSSQFLLKLCEDNTISSLLGFDRGFSMRLNIPDIVA
jgi:hypothetical protein